MQPLERSLRNQLERTVQQARDEAERAARVALEQLGVGEARPFAHLSPAEKNLRQRLRAYGRNLGDMRDPKTETQTIDRLVEDVAYQHWHRMLFARFLAENDLLMYPDPQQPVPISLEECHELAEEFGAANGWELAGRYAAQMLPQVFRPDSPVFELKLPLEYEIKLESLVAGLAPEVFTASDSLGWVYQFWQAKRKAEINASEVKIGARELPPVTQLFTEPYMVSFLLDNALGAWWAARRLTDDDLTQAAGEEELRQKAAIPGVPLTYLRFIKDEDGVWQPAAGTFDHWPQELKNFKVMDPCCGSGHFLVAALLMLTPMRMHLEGLSARDAVDAVLRQNIYGLELDKRCVELAAFAVALAAWRYPGAGGYRPLPNLNIACSGLAVNAKKEEWLSLAAGDMKVENALSELHALFQDAPVLGSLIDPRYVRRDLFTADYEDVAALLEQALRNGHSDEVHEAGVVAYGLARAARLLADKYHWVVTNVPYLTRGKQGDVLRAFCDVNYPEAKNDLANVFLQRCLKFLVPGGTTSIVMPQNWLFLTSYKKFRQKLLTNETWHLIARLGEGGFDSSAAAGAFTILLTMSKGIAPEGQMIRGLDVSALRTAEEKAAGLLDAEMKQVEQAAQLGNPDATVVLDEIRRSSVLGEVAFSQQGITTGDANRYARRFWEVPANGVNWVYWQSTPPRDLHYAGRESILFYEEGRGALANDDGATLRGSSYFGKPGIVLSLMRDIPVTISTGEISDDNTAILRVRDPEHLAAVWAYAENAEFAANIRRINQKINIAPRVAERIPFDLEYWTKVAEEKYPNGLPKPYSDDPTQWIFHGHPAQSEAPLQVAVARLLGYRWPAELDSEMELADEARAWVRRSEGLLPHTDEDGIVCIPPLRGERGAADRLLDLLAAAYGKDWSQGKLAQLLADADHAGKSLESWLRDKFFAQHCRLFLNRPFIWHIWDGLRDGFAALVNYHKLDRKTLESLIYTYLGEWIERQREAAADGVDGAEEKLAAAEGLKHRLELILVGESPYDIFVRWKPIEQQPIGWDPDLNDGVRLNIRPFMTVPDVGRKGAGVLRNKPNIHWRKDRGKDVPSAPWYDVFKGERRNDHHLTLQQKQEARRRAGLPA